MVAEADHRHCCEPFRHRPGIDLIMRAFTADGVGAEITAIEYELPARSVGNEELAALHPAWNMPQVQLKAGVYRRYWCAADETALDLAERACRKLASRADLSRIGALLFCTQTPDYIMPPNAGLLQHRLGLPRSIAALDYSLACSGFVHGLYLADALVRARSTEQVLLVTADTYSKLMHPDDRGPTTLFGDGAAATLISRASARMGHFIVGTDGGEASCFRIPAGGARLPHSAETSRPVMDAFGNVRSADRIQMNGAHVLDFFRRELPRAVTSLFRQAEVTVGEIDLVVLHQASAIAMDMVFRELDVPPAKRYSNLARVGNTVSASIPMALRDAEQEGVLRPGMLVLLVGFGVGLSWSGCLVRWK
jgi:3-oxoacyl-[acyl-carrier-protein] synthase-3